MSYLTDEECDDIIKENIHLKDNIKISEKIRQRWVDKSITRQAEINNLKHKLWIVEAQRDGFIEMKDHYGKKLEKIEELRLWIERDINAAKINKDKMAENMAICYNSNLKGILESK